MSDVFMDILVYTTIQNHISMLPSLPLQKQVVFFFFCQYLLPVYRRRRKRTFSIKLPGGVRGDAVNIPFYFNNRHNRHIVSKNNT